MELEGYVERIIYRNKENGYTVFNVIVDEEDATFVGTVEGISEGIYIIATGEWIEHPVYLEQFRIASYELRMPEDIDSIEHYLGSGAIKGIGPIMAKKIVHKYKLDTLRIMQEEPERLAEIKGISEKKARDIGIQFSECQDLREAMLFLSKYGINAQLAVKIFNEYGDRMYKIVDSNPYQIAEDITGVGFKIADEIARKVGIGTDSDFRIRSALLYTLLQATHLGYVYLPMRMLISKTVSLLAPMPEIQSGVYEEGIEQQILNLNLEKKLVIKNIGDQEVVYAASNYYIELNIARMLLDLNIEYDVPDIEVSDIIRKLEAKDTIELDELQRYAVKEAATAGVVIITGGPGTGKTTIINTIIQYYELQGMDLLLAAPTGRAAKRMTEATGYQAQTIHRLLELTGGLEGDRSYQFERNASNPLDTDVIIIDEMSMVDMNLMNSLLQATMPGTHLILVGDVNQLPSVGAGNILKDMIASNQFSVTKLTKIYRQEGESDIISNAHKINNGEHFIMDNKSRDFFLLPRIHARDAIDEIGRLVLTKMPKYVKAQPFDVQVLTPMRKGDLGVDNLNQELQKILNPPRAKKKEHETRNLIFREGDKVMQIKNNYKLEWTIYDAKGYLELDKGVGVFNGDMGRIREIDTYSEQVVVLFDDNKVVRYGYGLLEELELAYAITIHKSQGSEYPAVVIPLFTGPRVLMNRNLLYTAVTRAKQCVVIVGNGNMVDLMIDNTDEQKRYSSLDIYIQELAL